MPKDLLPTALLFACSVLSAAQNSSGTADANSSALPVSSPTVTLLIARTGLQTEAPHVATYHFAEFLQSRGKWVYPDIGYIDFGHNQYREIFGGGGRTLWDEKLATVTQELYFDQATGPAAKSARYIQPWTLVDVRLRPRFTGEVCYFTYLPLNRSARIQYVLERAKMEYEINRAWKIGGGYAGYKYGDNQWQNKPLLTTTVSTRAGAFEFWVQKLPGGGQIQFRYQLVRIAHR